MSGWISKLAGAACLALLFSGLHRGAAADAPPDPAMEHPAARAYDINEARRQDLIARQLDLNYRMIYQSGFGPRFPSPFEPWPRVPGDIYGYPGPRPVTHPIGHESLQVSPTRWIYRPVYADELAPPLALVPGAADDARVKQVELPAPSDLDEADRPAPRAGKAIPPKPGPREF